jgi:hypothetical protein
MKHIYTHIIILSLLCCSIGCDKEKKNDWSVSLDKNSKEPYGCYIFYQSLKDMFEGTEIVQTRNIFKQIKEVNKNSVSWMNKNQLVICPFISFGVDSTELQELKDYAAIGNTVILSCYNHSENISKEFGILHDTINEPQDYMIDDNDTIAKQPLHIEFNDRYYNYSFNGYSISNYYKPDNKSDSVSYIWGYTNKEENYNLLYKRIGNGYIILNRTPIAFTNYFLLQNNNINYIHQLISLFSYNTPSKIFWYQTSQKNPGELQADSGFQQLMKNPIFKTLFILLALLLILLVVFGSKRKQRIIPQFQKPKNDTLEYTETMGLLYLHAKDNVDLAQKMIKHFLDMLRVKYNMQLTSIEFIDIEKLANKLNKPTDDINQLKQYLTTTQAQKNINDQEIITLYNTLKKYN